MITYIVPAQAKDYAQIENFLLKKELSNIVALDALRLGSLVQTDVHWYIEWNNEKIVGLIFRDGNFLHFAYDQVPPPTFALYPFLWRNFAYFITYGSEEIVQGIVQQLQRYYQIKNYEHHQFVVQSKKTEKLLDQMLEKSWKTAKISIRLATPQDSEAIDQLFAQTPIRTEIDKFQIEQLIRLRRLSVATHVNNDLLGTIMVFKETKNYSLIGGLYVVPEARRTGIGQMLGIHLLKSLIKRKKRACFYFRQKPELLQLYAKGAFLAKGYWVSCHFYRKRNMLGL